MNDPASAIQDELFRALGGEGRNLDERARTLIRAAVSRVKFTPEQENVVGMFLSLGKSSGDLGDQDEDEHHGHEVEEDDGALRPEVTNQALQQELRALREANDTMAAALGACPYCWGGNDDCRTCCGAGCSGAKDPNLGLFDALVAPAVRRVAATRRRQAANGARSRFEPKTKEATDGIRHSR